MLTHFFSKKFLALVLIFFCALLGISTLVESSLVTAGPIPTRARQVELRSPGPDLVIESITLVPASPDLDQEFDISVKVKNQGDTDTGSTNFRIYLYVDPADQPPTGSTADTTWWSVFGLNAGASATFTRMGETFTTNGWHKIYAWVDRDDVIAEDNEDNNVASIDVQVGGGGGGDAYEDDNTCVTANSITTDGVAQTHNLDPMGDVDWVKFDVVANVTYLVEALNVGADADTMLSLVSQCGGPPGFGGGQRIEWTAPVSGTFYIEMEHHDSTYIADQSEYTISISEQTDCSNDVYELNNVCTTASSIATTGSTQRHTFCTANDADWLKFDATAGVTYTVNVQNEGSDADVVLSLTNQCNGPSSFGSGQAIEWVCPLNGTYYVKAENHDPNKFGAAATYDISVSGGGGCAIDDYEGNEDSAAAKAIAVNGTAQTHTFCPAADEDWIKFDAIHGTRYTIETSNLGNESDTFMALYGTDGGTLIAWDDDGGPGKGSRLTWDCSVDGTYYIKVRHHNPQSAGDGTRYDLSVKTTSCDPDSYENNDIFSAADSIPTDGTTQDHNFCAGGDVDWVKFTARAGVNYVIKTLDLGSSCDSQLYLYSSDGSTQLATNDDYGSGTGSRIDFTFSVGGVYYIKTNHYNSNTYGTGTEYKISIKEGTEPTPTPPPTITPTPTATPPPSQIKTLILVNRAQVEHYYNSTDATNLMNKLNTLAMHELVQGVVVQVENNGTVAQAYTDWNAALTSTDKANAVADAVRNLVLAYLNSNDSIEYVVIVGDDRIIPFRRTLDRTGYPEHNYSSASRSTTVGAACGDDMNLTDDYYVDKEPISWNNHEVYLPDLAIGRLIESPSEIMGIIDEFIENVGEINVGNMLVTGYDFVQDAAEEMRNLARQDIGPANIESLIGTAWTGSELGSKQFAEPPFVVQSINGHANHWTQGAPGAGSITANDILASTNDLSGALIYTLGCHSGLNVEPGNSTYPLDLAQAFIQKKANYVGNTGYGWGVRGLVGLSEKLMVNFTRLLLTDGSAILGKSLVLAKQSYYQQTTQFSHYDEKILIESTLYGLPMYQLITGSTLGEDDPFADDVIVTGGGRAIVLNRDLSSGTTGFSLNNSFGTMPEETHSFGNYYSLSGFTSSGPLEATQPLYFSTLNPPVGQQVRGLILSEGSYQDIGSFDPVIGLAENEHITTTAEPDYTVVGWRPVVPFSLFRPNNNNPHATMLFSMGQYNADGQTERVYDDVTLDVYYSTSPDYLAPTVLWIDGVRVIAEGKTYIKVEVLDDSGIQRVNVAYTDGTGNWYSTDLIADNSSFKWLGSFPSGTDTVCFVQIVDGAGNVTIDTNKGSYYKFAVGELPLTTITRWIYLPTVIRNK